MTNQAVSSAAKPGFAGDMYLIFLGPVLVGYAVIGKGFAYLGVPPLSSARSPAAPGSWS